MNTKDLEILVRRALLNPQMAVRGSLIFNKDAELMYSLGMQIVPAIEAVLLSECQNTFRLNPTELTKRFPGLGHISVFYFRLVETSFPDSTVRMLRCLEGPFLVEALHAINVVWLLMKPKPTCIPQALLQAVSDLAEQRSGEEQAVAQWLLKRLSAPNRQFISFPDNFDQFME